MEGRREGGREGEGEVRRCRNGCGGAAVRRRGAAAVQTAARKSSRLQRKHARSHFTRATKRRLNLRRGRCDSARLS